MGRTLGRNIQMHHYSASFQQTFLNWYVKETAFNKITEDLDNMINTFYLMDIYRDEACMQELDGLYAFSS